MRKKRITAVGALCAAALMFPIGSASADSRPDAGNLSSKAVNSVVAMQKQANTDAFIAKKDAPASALKGVCSKDKAQKSAADVADSAKKMSQSMSKNSKSPRHIDKVDVTIKKTTTNRKSNGNFLITTQLRISRHVAEDNVGWVEVVPHETEMDTQGCIVDITVKDRDYYDKHPGNSLPENPKGNSNSSQNSPSTKNNSTTQQTQSNSAPVSPALLSLSKDKKQKAVDYAIKYAENQNSDYYYYDGNDCTNFVSQAMFTGGWTFFKNPLYPLDYMMDSSWWYNSKGAPRNSWSWSAAENFYHMATGPRDYYGLRYLFRRTVIINNIYDLEPGDILQYKAAGETNMTHTMIVTRKAKDGMPYLSYHTDNTLDRPFSSMADKNVTWYAHRT